MVKTQLIVLERTAALKPNQPYTEKNQQRKLLPGVKPRITNLEFMIFSEFTLKHRRQLTNGKLTRNSLRPWKETTERRQKRVRPSLRKSRTYLMQQDYGRREHYRPRPVEVWTQLIAKSQTIKKDHHYRTLINHL